LKFRRRNLQRLLKPLALLLMLAVLFFPAATTRAQNQNQNQDQDQNQKSEQPKLRHMVAFKFKDSATPKQVDSIIKAFRALPRKIPQVMSIESGTNNSPENLNKGLTHAFLVTFANQANRDVYLVHPEHVKFKKLALPLVADVFVIDFFGKQSDAAGN
jgi:Stress responsive A/B Barrel Domain